MTLTQVDYKDSPVVRPLALERGDTVPRIWGFKFRNLDGTLSNVNLTGDIWELIFEWRDNILIKTTLPGGGIGVDFTNSRIAWIPQLSDVNAMPKKGATYKLRRITPDGERRTLIRGPVEVTGTGA